VFSQDIVARLRKRDSEAGSKHDHIRNNRLYVAGFGITMVASACALQDVVAALTVAAALPIIEHIARQAPRASLRSVDSATLRG
jgi:hypothetical protein